MQMRYIRRLPGCSLSAAITKPSRLGITSCDTLNTEHRKLNTSAIRRDCFSHTPPGFVQPPAFLNKCLELRLDGLSSPQAHSAQPPSLLRALRPHSRSQSPNCSLLAMGNRSARCFQSRLCVTQVRCGIAAILRKELSSSGMKFFEDGIT